jgi:hypothetical protein
MVWGGREIRIGRLEPRWSSRLEVQREPADGGFRLKGQKLEEGTGPRHNVVLLTCCVRRGEESIRVSRWESGIAGLQRARC